jgi:hypothetical protein
MKPLLILFATLLAGTWFAPLPAEAQARGYKAKKYKVYQRVSYRRPASVGPNGLCQRDTGTPTGQLNFRNQCDVEEFWQRTMERGRGWR